MSRAEFLTARDCHVPREVVDRPASAYRAALSLPREGEGLHSQILRLFFIKRGLIDHNSLRGMTLVRLAH